MLPRFICLILLLCCCPVLTWAQGLIKGRVIDKDHKPLSYAMAVLQNLPDNTVLKTELSDSAGFFSFTEPATYPVLVTITTSGYKPAFQTVTTTGKELEFVLEPAGNTLNELTVSAQKKLVERKIDRTIFNVEASVVSIGSDAYEALKKAPGVRVNNNGISIAGKSTVSVMLNDKLVQLSGGELEGLLRSIPSDNLLRIEVITTPPAKYDAEGNAGIINIVTKKRLDNGLNGNVNGSYTQRIRPSYGLSGAFNWRQNKLNIYGNGNSTRLALTNPQDITTYYSYQRQEQHLNEVEKPWFNRFELGADYNLTKRSVLSILYTNGNMDRDISQYYVTNVFRSSDNHVDSVLRTAAVSDDMGHRDVLDLNYDWDIDTGGKRLTADVYYFNRYGNSQRDFHTQNFFNDGNPTGEKAYNRTTGYQHIVISAGKLDMIFPTRIAKLSFGGKISSVRNYSDNKFTFLYGNDYITDTTRSNAFDYTENTQAAYLSAEKSLGKWQLQAGLRTEYTQTTGYSATLHQTNTNDYFKLFPTVYIQYTANEDHIFSINYSRRIDRPEFWFMNPFRQYFTANSYEQGNPFLQPSFSHNIELNYSFHENYTFSLYTQQMQQVYTRVSMIDSSNSSFYFNMANAGTVSNSGLHASANTEITKWWETEVEANLAYNHFSSTYYNTQSSYGRLGFNFEMNNSFTLNAKKTLLAELGCFYQTREQYGFDINYSQFSLLTGMKALFLDKQLTLAFSLYDPFRGEVERSRNLYNGTYQNSYYDNRALQFSINWKFGNRYIKDKRQRNVNSEEARRAGG